MSNAKQRYLNYLQTDHWKDLKAKAAATQGATCQICASFPVQWHHLIYRKRLTDSTPRDLMPLCRRCHDGVHKYGPLKAILDGTDDPEKRRAIIKAHKHEIIAHGRQDADEVSGRTIEGGATAGSIWLKAACSTHDITTSRGALLKNDSDAAKRSILIHKLRARKAQRQAVFNSIMSGLMARNSQKGG